MSSSKNLFNIPFIDLNRQNSPEFQANIMQSWQNILNNKSFINGQGNKQLAEALVQYTGSKYCINVANGTDALQIALRAYGIGLGDIVIVPDLTFWASVEAIYNVGAIPLIVDINEHDLQLNYQDTINAIKSYKPKAILLVHLYGWTSEQLEDFRNLAQKYNIKLIEDGAQAIATEYNNQSVFAGANIITTSFYPAKVLGGAGDGGAVFTNDEDLCQKIASLANHGRSEHYAHKYIGWNSRLDELQAYYILNNLNNLNNYISSRQYAENYYKANIKTDKFIIKSAPGNVKSNSYLQVSLAHNQEERDYIMNYLAKHNIQTGQVYPMALSEQKALVSQKYLAYLPNYTAQSITKRIFNLPLFPYMTEEELEYICNIINKL